MKDKLNHVIFNYVIKNSLSTTENQKLFNPSHMICSKKFRSHKNIKEEQ